MMDRQIPPADDANAARVTPAISPQNHDAANVEDANQDAASDVPANQDAAHPGAALGQAGAAGAAPSAARAASVWKSLDPATIWLPALEVVAGTIVPAFFAGFYVGHLNVALFLLCFVFVPVAAFFVFRFLTLRYRLTDSDLLVKTGVINRRERRVPLDRIQDSEIRQGFLHRLLKLARFETTTAGSDDLEISLNVLALRDALSLKTAITARHDRHRSMSAAIATDEQCLCQLKTRDLVMGGVTSNVIASVGALVGAILYFKLFFTLGADWWDQMDDKAFTHTPISRLYDGLAPNVPQDGVMGQVSDWVFADTLTKSVVLVTAGLFFAIGTYVVRYHGFHLIRRQGILEKTHGLLTYRKSSLASERIQAMKIEEGLLRRLFKLASVRVDSAGDRNEIGDQRKRDVLVPIMQREAAFSLASQTLPNLAEAEPVWKKLSAKAIMKRSKKGWLLLAVVILQTYWLAEWMALIWLPAIPLVYFWNYQWYRNTGYFIDNRYLIRRHGWLNREVLFLPTRNVQNVSLIQSYFDRRSNLATLSVDTAGQSNTGGGPIIRYLPLDEAKKMHHHLAMRASAVDPII